MITKTKRLLKMAGLILCLYLCLMVSGKAQAWDGALKEWMKYLPDSVQLSQINLPGTHDSATFAITFWSTTWAQCHDDNIREQLDHGIRVFDLRLRTKKADPTNIFAMELNHGDWSCWQSATSYEKVRLGNIMDDVSSFLKAHPTETVVLIVTDECQGDPARKQQVKDNLATLRSLYQPFKEHPGQKYGDMFYFFDDGDYVPTLGQVRGKCVIVDDYGTMTSYENNWSSYASDKIKYIKNAVQTAGVQNWGGLITDRFISENYENPERPGEPNVKIFFTSSNAGFLEGPRKASQKTNPEFEKMTLKNGDRYGWVLMDFPTEKMIKKVIASNQNTVQLRFVGNSYEILREGRKIAWELYRYNSTHPAELVLDESSGIKWFREWRYMHGDEATLQIDNMPRFDENGELWSYRLESRFFADGDSTYFYTIDDGVRKPLSTYNWMNRDVESLEIEMKGVLESLDNTFKLHIIWEDNNNGFGVRPKTSEQFVRMMGGVTLTEVDPGGFGFTRLVNQLGPVAEDCLKPFLEYNGQDVVTVRNLSRPHWGNPVSYETTGFHNIAANSPYFFTGYRKIGENEYEVTLRHRALADIKTVSGTVNFSIPDSSYGRRVMFDLRDELRSKELITIIDYYNDEVYDTYNVVMGDYDGHGELPEREDAYMHSYYTLKLRDYGDEHTQMIVFPEMYGEMVRVGTSVDGRSIRYSTQMELSLYMTIEPWYFKDPSEEWMWKYLEQHYKDQLPYGYGVVVEYRTADGETHQVSVAFANVEGDDNQLVRKVLVPQFTEEGYSIIKYDFRFANEYACRNKDKDWVLVWGIRQTSAQEMQDTYNVTGSYIRSDGMMGRAYGVSVWPGNKVPASSMLPGIDDGFDRIPYSLTTGFSYGEDEGGLHMHLIGNTDAVLTDEEMPFGCFVELRNVMGELSQLSDADAQAIRSAMRSDEDVAALMDIILFKYVFYDRTQIDEVPNGKLTLQLDVPEQYRGRSGIQFDVLRLHDGQAERLGCEYDRRNETLTFQSDRFSVFVITASKTQDVTGSINVTVHWENGGHASKPVPGSVNAILNNDEGFERKFPLEKSSSWKYTFQDMLLAHSVNGQLYPVSYTLRADMLEGFTQAISGDAEHGFVITYTAIPPIPVTGDNTNLPLLVGMLVLSMGALAVLVRRRKVR